MPEHRLKPITALGGTAARSQSWGSTTLSEQPEIAIASVALRAEGADTARAHLDGLIGTSLPEAGHWAGTGPVRALWTGVDQWFLLAPYESHELMADELEEALAGVASVTEQSDGWSSLRLEGPGAMAVLERLSMLDLPQAGPSFMARTVMHHIGCMILKDGDGDAWQILGPRSSAQSMFESIAHVAAGILPRD